MYSGLQPAITALMATFSAVIDTARCSTKAICCLGSSRAASSILATFGLPVVPPPAPKVARMLEAARLDPKQQIAFVEHRAGSITAEKVGINAVVAGWQPGNMPGAG